MTKPETDGSDRECPTCGVTLVQGEILCPTCYLQGQQQAPPRGYHTYVWANGQVGTRRQTDPRIQNENARRKSIRDLKQTADP